jgi:hypothetical protein
VEKVDVGTRTDGERIILSFQVAGGIPMAFELSRDVALKMADVLTGARHEPEAPPGLTKQW